MISDVDFINFKDMIYEDNFSKEWTIVTIHDESDVYVENEHRENFSIYSKLILNKQEYLDTEFDISEWISGWGNLKKCSEEKAHFEIRESISGETIMAKEFFCQCSKDKIQLDKDFIDTYNLKLNDDESMLVDNNDEPIVKYEDRKIVKIKSEYLRDYLEKYDACLVRGYDCLRKISIPPSDLIGEKRDEDIQRDYDRRLKITIVEYRENSNIISLSRLLGKDVVFPQKMFVK